MEFLLRKGRDLSNLKQNKKSEVRIDDIARNEEVNMISQLSVGNNEEDIDQAIWNEVDGEFDFLPELPFSERRDITSPRQKNVWNCIICDKIFKTKYYLKEHSRVHTGEINIG